MNIFDQPATQNRFDAPAPTPPSLGSTLGKIASGVGTFIKGAVDPLGSAIGAGVNFLTNQAPADTTKGIVQNTVKGLPAATGQVAADIFHGLTRSFGSVGQTILNVVYPGADTSTITPPQNDALGKKFFELFYGGDQPINTLGQRIVDAQKAIETSPLAQKYGLDKFAFPLALGGVLGNTALDLTPWGGSEKQVAKEVAQTVELNATKSILERLTGGDAELTKKFTNMFADARTEEEAMQALDALKNAQGLKAVAEKANNLSPEEIAAFQKEMEAYQLDNPLAQLAKRLISGQEKIAVSNDLKTEALTTLGKGLYARVFSKSTGKSLDEHATDLGYEMGQNLTSEDIVQAVRAEADRRAAARAQAAADRAARKELRTNSKLAYAQRTGVDQSGNIVENVPPEIVDKARADWQTNFDQQYQSLYTEGSALQEQLKGAKGAQKILLEERLRTLTDQQAKLEEQFVTKWRQEAGLPPVEQGARMIQQVERAGTKKEGSTNLPLSEADRMRSVKEIQQGQFDTPAKFIQRLGQDEQAGLKPLMQEQIRTVKEKVHAADYLATPEFVLERIGLGKEAAMLQHATDKYHAELKTAIDKITAWKNEVSNIPGSEVQIFKYLDGQPRVQLEGVELKVANEIRNYLSEWADRLNLPASHRIAYYITHLFEKDLLKKEFDPEFAKIITDKVAGSVYDPFLEKRLGTMGYREDVWGALDAYVKRASRKEAYDPALKALKEAADQLDLESYRYVMRLSHRINLRPTEVDNLVDNFIKSLPVVGYRFGVRPLTALSTKIRQIFYRGTLGLNFASALRNLTQGANTYAKLGNRYTIVGYTKLFSRLTTNNLKELYTNGVLADDLLTDQKIGVYKTLLQKADKGLFYMFEAAEKINRGAAYFGAKSMAINRGASEQEAINFAKRMVRETQFAFGNVDAPVIMSSDIAKTLLQLQTYNVKQVEFLARMIKNKEYGGLVRFSLASFGFLYTIGRLFGMTPQQLIPSVGLGGGPFGNALSTLVGVFNPNATQQERDQAKADAGRIFATLIPAGAQLRKTVGGLEVYNAGKDVTPTGRTRFKVPHDFLTGLRATLFGKSSLPQAQKYYASIGKKSTSSGNRFDQ